MVEKNCHKITLNIVKPKMLVIVEPLGHEFIANQGDKIEMIIKKENIDFNDGITIDLEDDQITIYEARESNLKINLNGEEEIS